MKGKRTTRKMTEEHKQKISQAMTGKKLPVEHKLKISKSMKKYWGGIPYE